MIKPVILLPFSLLSQLPAAQVEAILLHELAHIRRRDYFVNLLFSFSELVFFFNPGVLWICTLIREERENCCDDIAIREAGNKKEFISALVSFQYDRKAAISAIAFPGSGNHLLQRVRRIIYQDNKTLDGREKFFLLFCCLISGVLMLAFTHSSQMDSSLPHSILYHKPVPAPGIGHSVKDTLPGDSSEVHDRAVETTHDERSVRDSAAAAAVKAERKAKEKAEKEQQKMEEKEQKEKAETDKEKVKEEIKEQKEKAETDKEKVKAEIKERQEMELKERDEQKEMMEIKERQEKEEMDQEKGGRKERKEKIEAREQKEKAERDERQEGHIRVSEDEKRLDEQLDRLRREEKRLAEEDIRLTEATRQIQIEKKRMAEQYLLADSSFRGKRGSFERGKRKAESAMDRMEASRRDHQILSSIVGDLIRKHLIDNNNEFSFVLKEDELIVNGVRQPDELLLQFRKKYLGDPTDFVLFSKKKDGSESSSIHIHSISI